MAGRSASAAVSAFIEPLQQALSCVTRDVLIRTPDSQKPGGVRSVKVPKGAGYVPLQGERRLHLSVALEYEVVELRDDKVRGPWKIRTRQYRYHVVSDDHAEVVLYHWLPEGKCSTKRPHVHVGQSQLSRDAVFTHKQHMPTGRVSLEENILMLIEELNVVPLKGNYREVLEDGHAKFCEFPDVELYPADSYPTARLVTRPQRSSVLHSSRRVCSQGRQMCFRRPDASSLERWALNVAGMRCAG